MSDIINFSFSSDIILKQSLINEIINTNEETQKYGLVLRQEDVLALVDTRNESLKDFGRVEVGAGVINKIITAFCNSQYIWQENYASTISELLETFYYMKSETLDLVGDDALIMIMKDFFENSCRGSIDLLQGRELETLARKIRYEMSDDIQVTDEFNEEEL